MKRLLLVIGIALLLPACGLLQRGEQVVFNEEAQKAQVEVVEMVPYLSTNSLGQVSTNYTAQTVLKEVDYQAVKINPQVDKVAKNVGGYFGPVGEGITGLALLALGVYGNIKSSINKRKAISKEREATTLVESIEIAKDVIQDIEPAKAQEFIDQIKRKQELTGTREGIRKMIK